MCIALSCALGAGKMARTEGEPLAPRASRIN
jgi:hypothetical protein